MTSIGCRCRDGNVHSRAILITQTLSGQQCPQNEVRAASPTQSREARERRSEKPRSAPAAHKRRHAPQTSNAAEVRKQVRVHPRPPQGSPEASERKKISFQALFSPYTGSKVLITQSLDNETKVAIARGLHLFPFRTEKLTPATPMVLRKWESR